ITHPALHSFPTRRSSDLLAPQPNGRFLSGSLTWYHESSGASCKRHEACTAPGTDSEGLPRVIVVLAVLARMRRQKARSRRPASRSEEHTSELQSPCNLVC